LVSTHLSILLVGVRDIVLKMTKDFFEKSEYRDKQLLESYFNCKIEIDENIDDYLIVRVDQND